jgi:hypothetical protein
MNSNPSTRRATHGDIPRIMEIRHGVHVIAPGRPEHRCMIRARGQRGGGITSAELAIAIAQVNARRWPLGRTLGD